MTRRDRSFYRLGAIHALKRAREDLHAIAERLDREVAEVASLLNDVRAEQSRLQSIEAAAAERRPDGYLDPAF